MVTGAVLTIVVGVCQRCGEPWPKCSCGRATTHSTLDHMEPEPPLEEVETYAQLVERLAGEPS